MPLHVPGLFPTSLYIPPRSLSLIRMLRLYLTFQFIRCVNAHTKELLTLDEAQAEWEKPRLFSQLTG